MTASLKASDADMPAASSSFALLLTSSTLSPSASSRMVDMLAKVRITCCMSQPSVPTTVASRVTWPSLSASRNDMICDADAISSVSEIMPRVASRSLPSITSAVVPIDPLSLSKR